MELDKFNQNYVRGWKDGSNGFKNSCRDCVPGKFTNYRKMLRDKENKQNETNSSQVGVSANK
jgi:hypothetical protein